MTEPRPPLHPSSAASIAATALALQGQYGVVTDLAREHELRRQSVYDLRDRAQQVLEAAFTSVPAQGAVRHTLCVTEADVQRAIVALRVMLPASIRDIEEVLPVLFDVRYSYGRVWNVVHAAETAAAAFNRTVDLSGIDSLALDELFSQGQPVLSGIDLDTGYVCLLQPSDSRSGEAWAAVLGQLRDGQQLVPARVVKDAGTGLAAGVKTAWPGCDAHDDLFHAVFLMGKQQVRLERRAYREMEAVALVERRRTAAQSKPHAQRRSIGQQLRAANKRMEAAMVRHDHFETLARQATDILELADRGSGRLRTQEEVVLVLSGVAQEMALLGEGPREVATYLSHRASGLGLYLKDLAARLEAVSESVGGPCVVEAVVRAYQASLMHSRRAPCWDRKARRAELAVATQQLVWVTAGEPQRLVSALGAVLPVLSQRHRASSAIENLHSVLRPYLVVQKHAQAGFLALFQAYSNLRKRPSGRFQGTSAYQLLTGQTVSDWLTVLGLPPSASRAAAA